MYGRSRPATSSSAWRPSRRKSRNETGQHQAPRCVGSAGQRPPLHGLDSTGRRRGRADRGGRQAQPWPTGHRGQMGWRGESEVNRAQRLARLEEATLPAGALAYLAWNDAPAPEGPTVRLPWRRPTPAPPSRWLTRETKLSHEEFDVIADEIIDRGIAPENCCA